MKRQFKLFIAMFGEPQKDRSFWRIAWILFTALLIGSIIGVALWVLVGFVPMPETALRWVRALVVVGIAIMTARRAVTRTLEYYALWRWGKYGD